MHGTVQFQMFTGLNHQIYLNETLDTFEFTIVGHVGNARVFFDGSRVYSNEVMGIEWMTYCSQITQGQMRKNGS